MAFSIDWEGLYYAVLTASLPLAACGYFLTERSKRRELRIQHLATAKQEAFRAVVEDLNRLIECVSGAHVVADNIRSEADVITRYRSYCLSAGLARIQIPPLEKMESILAEDNKEEMSRLINRQMFDIAYEIMPIRGRLQNHLFQAGCYINDPAVLETLELISHKIGGIQLKILDPNRELDETLQALVTIEGELRDASRLLIKEFQNEFGKSRFLPTNPTKLKR